MWEPCCSMQTHGRTDGHVKLVVDFRNFANAPEEGNLYTKVYTTCVESHNTVVYILIYFIW